MPTTSAASLTLSLAGLAVPALALGGCGSSATPPATGGDGRDTAPVLRATWQGYLRDFVQSDGRVVDPARGGATTSEGQSYAMLRAAWMADRAAFDRSWRWTRDNLANRDGLFGYLWGRRGDGSFGLLDGHSATDADQDIALALLVAARRWNDGSLLDSARSVVQGIWRTEVARVDGTPYVTAGPWATQTQPGPTLNPSYFAPYAYRLFAAVDGGHDWQALVDSSYHALDLCTDAPLAAGRSAGLPPNWCVIDGHDGSARHSAQMQDADAYGYDAFRVAWRIALDWQWSGDSRAQSYLRRIGVLHAAWRSGSRLASVYGHDGSVVSGDEKLAAYGADIGLFVATDQAAATQILRDKLLAAVRHDGGAAHFGDGRDYYDQNWAWFGLALAAGQIPPQP